MAVPLIVAGSILLIDKIGGIIIRDKKEQDAKKDGADLAAKMFVPLIDMTKECTVVLKSIIEASDRDLELMLLSLEEELFKLEDVYDEAYKRLSLKQKISNESCIKQLGTNSNLDGSRESIDKYFMALSTKIGLHVDQDITASFDKIKVIFSEPVMSEEKVCVSKCTIVSPISSILSAINDDYDEARMEQFKKECVVWTKRLNDEKKLFFAELDKYEELIESGESERIYYQCRIFERVNQIANMKMLINMYGEL